MKIVLQNRCACGGHGRYNIIYYIMYLYVIILAVPICKPSVCTVIRRGQDGTHRADSTDFFFICILIVFGGQFLRQVCIEDNE